MRCRTALGKLPLVLTPFAKFTVNESPEAVAKLIFTAQQKLSKVHCFYLRVAQPEATTNSLPLTIRGFGLAQTYRI
jgi:hypothetical protein